MTPAKGKRANQGLLPVIPCFAPGIGCRDCTLFMGKNAIQMRIEHSGVELIIAGLCSATPVYG